MFRRLLPLILGFPYLCHAGVSTFELEMRQIPTQPSQPPMFVKPEPHFVPPCARFCILNHRKFEVDSFLAVDAERLKPVFEDVPQAMSELQTYQNNRAQLRTSAYLGTAALLLLGTGLMMQRTPVDVNSGVIQPNGYLILTGATLGIGTIVHLISTLATNDLHIEHAIKYYNQAHPEKPIEPLFSTGIHF
ncbi:hypothetical protein EBS43_06350 [bacterium]|nr:hypothetical protein [bacterium]